MPPGYARDTKFFPSNYLLTSTPSESDVIESIRKLHSESTYSREELLSLIVLRGTAFLDIDKLVEYRKPDDAGVYVIPRAPQLDLALQHSDDRPPVFIVRKCNSCKETIRGAFFECLDGCRPTVTATTSSSRNPNDDSSSQTLNLCEDCARKVGQHRVHPPEHLRKKYKHCLVPACVSPQQAINICHCPVPTSSGPKFPFQSFARRRRHHDLCPLVHIMRQHIRAREDDLRHCGQLKSQNETIQNSSSLKSQSVTLPQAGWESGSSTSIQVRRNSGSVFSIPASILARKSTEEIDTLQNASVLSTKSTSKRAMKSLLTPFAKKIAEDIPFGNVHLAISFGPLVIENGVPDTKRGVLVTLRDRLQLLGDTGDTIEQGPALAVASFNRIRQIYQAERLQAPRRLKACMKQIVSGLFCGINRKEREDAFVRDFTTEVAKCRYLPLRTAASNTRRRQRSIDNIMAMLRGLIQPYVDFYLNTLVDRLCHRNFKLEFNIRKNNCQIFCDQLLNRSMFGDLIATVPHSQAQMPKKPLYLMSFVTGEDRSGVIAQRIQPKSVKSAPNGVTEEFLLRFRELMQHNDSDIHDTLMEYWTDWGAFGAPIFQHHDLFPWDCTEAFGTGSLDGEDSIKCNDCSTTKHVWAFPFDSWSICHFHLFRAPRFYADPSGEKVLSLGDWIKNRLRNFLALHALTIVAVALSKTPKFRTYCRWMPCTLHRRYTERKRRRMLKNSDRKPFEAAMKKAQSRARLGGIFRAQPKSHVFERQKYHDCGLARWADLVHDEKIKEYKRLRDWRADDLVGYPPRERIPPRRTRNVPREREMNDRFGDRVDRDRSGPDQTDDTRADNHQDSVADQIDTAQDVDTVDSNSMMAASDSINSDQIADPNIIDMLDPSANDANFDNMTSISNSSNSPDVNENNPENHEPNNSNIGDGTFTPDAPPSNMENLSGQESDIPGTTYQEQRDIDRSHYESRESREARTESSHYGPENRSEFYEAAGIGADIMDTLLFDLLIADDGPEYLDPWSSDFDPDADYLPVLGTEIDSSINNDDASNNNILWDDPDLDDSNTIGFENNGNDTNWWQSDGVDTPSNSYDQQSSDDIINTGSYFDYARSDIHDLQAYQPTLNDREGNDRTGPDPPPYQTLMPYQDSYPVVDPGDTRSPYQDNYSPSVEDSRSGWYNSGDLASDTGGIMGSNGYSAADSGIGIGGVSSLFSSWGDSGDYGGTSTWGDSGDYGGTSSWLNSGDYGGTSSWGDSGDYGGTSSWGSSGDYGGFSSWGDSGDYGGSSGSYGGDSGY